MALFDCKIASCFFAWLFLRLRLARESADESVSDDVDSPIAAEAFDPVPLVASLRVIRRSIRSSVFSLRARSSRLLSRSNSSRSFALKYFPWPCRFVDDRRRPREDEREDDLDDERERRRLLRRLSLYFFFFSFPLSLFVIVGGAGRGGLEGRGESGLHVIPQRVPQRAGQVRSPGVRVDTRVLQTSRKYLYCLP